MTCYVSVSDMLIRISTSPTNQKWATIAEKIHELRASFDSTAMDGTTISIAARAGQSDATLCAVLDALLSIGFSTISHSAGVDGAAASFLLVAQQHTFGRHRGFTY